jgi:hypothetical protein
MAKTKRNRIIITDLEKQGCTVRETASGGWMVYFPDGKTSMPIHNTDSDQRAEKNTRSRVLRAGLTWVFDHK